MHEYGHALTARRYGIETRDITLLPIGGVARLERMPRDPVQELWIALAGPAVNVVIAAVLALILIVTGGSLSVENVGLDARHLLNNLLSVNLSLALFNLLPAFPMDGGRVLRALLARRMPYERATRAAASVGQIMAFLFGFWGLLGGGIVLLFIALFVYMGAETEAQAVQVESAFRDLPVGRVMVTRFASLSPTDTLGQAVQVLLSSSQQDFPVREDGQVVGLLMRRDLLAALHTHGPSSPVSGAMRRDVTPVEARGRLDEIFQRMQTDGLTALPVTQAGHLAGLLTMENIAEFLMVTAALEGAPTVAGEAVEREAAATERGTGTAGAAEWRPRRGEPI
jgi:Zn-dependent protease